MKGLFEKNNVSVSVGTGLLGVLATTIDWTAILAQLTTEAKTALAGIAFFAINLVTTAVTGWLKDKLGNSDVE
jgi:hypothetical protein